MTYRSTRKKKRQAAYAVEFAFVAIVFFMFLFGIVEYGRLVMIINILDNAAREGARYAIVNTSLGSGLTAAVQNQVDGQLAGVQNSLTGYNKTTSIVVKAVNPSTGAQLVDASNNTIAPENTQFGQSIQVQITATYQPMLPTLLKMPSSLTLTATSEMASETN